MAEHLEVDIRNTMWPYPKYVIPQVLEKLASAEKGTVVDILVDCPSAVDEIPGILKGEGYSVNTIQVGGGEYKIRAEK